MKSRKLRLYKAYFRLKDKDSLYVYRSRLCLAYSQCHCIQVLIRSLLSENVDLDSIELHPSLTVELKVYR